MIPENLRYGGGATESLASPIALIAVGLAIIAILFVRRQNLVYPFLLGAILIPLSQVIVVGGLHFQMMRILIIAGWIRILLEQMTNPGVPIFGKLNPIDRTFILWAVVCSIAFVLCYQDSASVINRLGFLFTTLGTYFFLRFIIWDEETIKKAIRAFAILVVLFAIAMSIERLVQFNVFSVLGGIPAASEVREGAIRARGSFGHSILAGSFGATLVGAFIGLWVWDKKSRGFVVAGLLGSTVMMITSASSTPILAYLATIGALCLWPIRKKMRWLRWAIALTIITLHLVMKAPVWALIGRVDVVPGNSSYHRYKLVDAFITHFWEWWLVGTSQASTWGWDMWDAANEFVNQGEQGGLLTFILFITLFVRAWRGVGQARKKAEGVFANEFFYWALGAVMFAHSMTFFGISYFDQTVVWWYATLVIIGAVTPVLVPETATAPFALKPAEAKPSRWSWKPAPQPGQLKPALRSPRTLAK